MGIDRSAPIPASINRKEQVGWYFYDWANSAFSTTVAGVFLPPYLTSIAKAAADADGYIYPLGIQMFADSYYPRIISFSVLLQVLILPILGAIADHTALKKRMLGACAFLGALMTTLMFFVQGENYMLGGLLFILANLGFGASIVFYNAFLPEIATANERDRISSQGWALGYLGGGLLLLLNLLFVQLLAPRLGMSTNLAVRISLASAGIWWALFTLVPLVRLKQRQPVHSLKAGQSYLTVGFQQLGQTMRQLPLLPHTLLFLIAYLFYNDGIQTVISLSSQFGSQELGMTTGNLALLFLMVQFVAFFGAIGFNWLALRMTTKRAIMLSLVIWGGTVLYAWGVLRTESEFFALGAVIAIVLGGSQALSRSLFSQMIPRNREAEYFSLYEISERGTSWMGPMLFAVSLEQTRSYRVAILSVVVFFVIGLLILPFVNIRRAISEAGNEVPKGV